MRNLVLFFIKFHAFFIFLLLEVVALFLLVQTNDTQNQLFLGSANTISGKMLEMSSNTRGYIGLRQKNADLSKENAALKKDLQAAKSPSTGLDSNKIKGFIPDSLLWNRYEFIPSLVINNSIDRPNNYITLNVGEKDGVQKNTGILAGNGLVGIVRKVSENYSVGMSLLHRDIKISVRIRRERFLGSLVWKDEDPRFMMLEAIPKHVEIPKDSTVITSGYSSVFPANLVVGKIEEVTEIKGDNFYQIKVKLAENLSGIEHVYVVKHLMRDEQLKLEEAVQSE